MQERMVRGELWAIVHNTVTGEHVRINSALLDVIRRIDGRSSLQSLLPSDKAAGRDGCISNDSLEAIALGILSLSQCGMLNLGLPGEADRLLLQHRRLARNTRRGRWLNPLAVRMPLHNPDRWLDRLSPWFSGVFSKAAFYGVFLLFLVALTTALSHVSELGAQFERFVDTPDHWWLLGLVYPVLKVFHELAHALAIKNWGGRVHEIGITLLVLMPVPYIDASDSWWFNRRYQRLLVSAAGMLAEGAIASVALILFFIVEPGIVRDLAFTTALTGSVSTLLFNANPLLKFDGYQILQDAVDMPNLARRSVLYLQYLIRRYLFQVQSARSPATGVHERRWLVAYGISSQAFRWVITLGIAAYLVKHVLIIGVGLGLFALYQLGIKPVIRGFTYVHHAEELTGHRQQAIAKSTGLLAALLVLVFLIPLPASTRAEGVVWVPGQARLLAGEAGEIVDVLVKPGSQVQANELLIRLASPLLLTELDVVEAEIMALRSEHFAVSRHEVTERRLIALDINSQIRAAELLRQRILALEIRAKKTGRYAPPDERVLVGRYVKQGDELGFVVGPGDMLVKAIVEQQQLGLVQAGILSSSVRLAEYLDTTIPAPLVVQIPAADRRLPSLALASAGSGGIAVAKSIEGELETLVPVFHVELKLPETAAASGIGGRAYVTLVHPAESLGKRWWRTTRQLFLEQLSV